MEYLTALVSPNSGAARDPAAAAARRALLTGAADSGAAAGPVPAAAGASLLTEWNSYATKASPGGAAGLFASLAAPASPGATTLSAAAESALLSVQGSLAAFASNFQAPAIVPLGAATAGASPGEPAPADPQPAGSSKPLAPGSGLFQQGLHHMHAGMSKAGASLADASAALAKVHASVGRGAAAAAAAAGGAVSDGLAGLQALSPQRLALFGAFLLAGLALLAVSLFIGLPGIVLFPSKFAVSLSLGSLSIMAAVGSLRGWQAQLEHLAHPDRLPFATLYFGSVLATLWAALSARSYLLSLGFSIGQLIALAYYLATFFPGGIAGFRLVSSLAVQLLGPLMRLVCSVLAPVFGCAGKACGMGLRAGAAGCFGA